MEWKLSDIKKDESLMMELRENDTIIMNMTELLLDVQKVYLPCGIDVELSNFLFRLSDFIQYYCGCEPLLITPTPGVNEMQNRYSTLFLKPNPIGVIDHSFKHIKYE